MKNLELNGMEVLIGGDGPWWDNLAWGGVCGVVGLIAGVGTANPFVGAAVSFTCNAIGTIADAAND